MATGERPLGTSPLGIDVDVAIIGNGPSAIALSFLLSGYRPYWNGVLHPNEYLGPKLSENVEQSIVDQDLELLSEGLSGRSINPVSLLYDQLLLPNADLGVQAPPVLEWRYHKELAIQHVVLGRDCVGGSWTNMPADLQSLSYARWLQLPNMPIDDFFKSSAMTALDRGRCGVIAHYYQQYVRRNGLHTRFVCGAEVTHVRRLDGSDVDCADAPAFLSILQSCQCCVSPPAVFAASPTFDAPDTTVMNGHTASGARVCTMRMAATAETSDTADAGTRCSCTSCVSSSDDSIDSRSSSSSSSSESGGSDALLSPPITCSSSSSSLSMLEDAEQIYNGMTTTTTPLEDGGSAEHAAAAAAAPFNWSVCGCRARKPFQFKAKQLVLAVGTSDEPRRLNVPGEGLDLLSYGCPTPSRLRAIAASVSVDKPLLVVGCGLTAADTVLLALQHDLPVVHMFGRAVSDTSLVLNRMPSSVYPEYARVSKLMRTSVARTDRPLVFASDVPYVSLPCHHIISVSPDSCTLQDAEERDVILPCSYVFVAAGSRPNLSFLPQSGQNLAVDPCADFNYRVNPVDVDRLSFESKRMPDLYAMGPLVGDNFVRFAIGASLGITKSLAAKLHGTS